MNSDLLKVATATALQAGKRILEIYHEADFEIEMKADATPITRADRAAHTIIIKELRKTNIPIVSEEGEIAGYAVRKNWQRFWLVDPLDGTKEFVKKNGEFTVNIALIEEGKATLGVIYVPILETLYYGAVNQEAIKAQCKQGVIIKKTKLPLPQEERTHSIIVASRSFKDAATENYISNIAQEVQTVSRGSSLKLCMIAEGSADVYPRFVNLKEWDIAAGVAIVNAAGGKVCEVETDKELLFNSEDLQAPFFIAKKRV